MAPSALAQAQSTATVQPIQTPPPVPGLEYPESAVVSDGLDVAAILAATPPAPGAAPGVDEVAAREGAVNTNLGGSDVAVTSEGGSYEVDAPKRRAKRRGIPTPQP